MNCRPITVALVLTVMTFSSIVAEKSSKKEHPTPDEKPLVLLSDDLLGEHLTSSVSSSLAPASTINPSPDPPSTTVKPAALSTVPTSPDISPPSKPLSDSSVSNLLTGEDDSDNSSSEEDLDSKPPRKLITFDQRQEGQYNIRADLDNFMIVVIPPNPTAGISLLDLLTRSSSKRGGSSSKKSNKKHQYMYGHDGSYGTKPNHYPLERSKNNQQHISYLNKILQSHHNSAAASPSMHGGGGHSSQFSDYIEGRTPYHVDISSSNSAANEFASDKVYGRGGASGGRISSASSDGGGSDSQIDVIPPPYPLNYQQLMKPFHLEVEPHIVQIPVQHSTAHAIPPQVPTNIYNPSTISTSQQQQQQHQQQQQQLHKHQQQQKIPWGFLSGNFNPASVARE